MIPKEIRECAAQLITSMRNRRVSEVRWKAHDALIALADVVEAGNEEHGPRDRETECNLCQALARVEALKC